MEVANDNIQESAQIILRCEEGDNNTDHFSAVISMVPSRLRELSPKSFDPRVVSIGPLHHEDENLKRFEGRKRTYIRDLMSRLNFPPLQTVEACLRVVNATIDQIRSCYAGMGSYTNPELARMMVTDSCFILEFIYKYSENAVNGLCAQSICVDLLLVENQIPFFVLNDIFKCTILKSTPTVTITNYVLPLLQFGNLFHTKLRLTYNSTNHDHILGLLHTFYNPYKTHPLSCIPSKFDPLIIHNAVELDKAGVRFKPNKVDEPWIMVMEVKWSRCGLFSWFWSRPTLTMPVLMITEFTELKLRNLIAYEQKCEGHYVASYAMALDLIVDSQEDIGRFVKSQIMLNAVGSNEEAAKMVNNICKEVAIHDFFYIDQWKQLHSYYNGYWPRNIAWLKRTYFNNPWNIIALLAGIILFALTTVQTYFTAVQTCSSYPKNNTLLP